MEAEGGDVVHSCDGGLLSTCTWNLSGSSGRLGSARSVSITQVPCGGGIYS